MKYEINTKRTSAENLSNYDATSDVVFSLHSKCDINCQSLWLGVNIFSKRKMWILTVTSTTVTLNRDTIGGGLNAAYLLHQKSLHMGKLCVSYTGLWFRPDQRCA